MMIEDKGDRALPDGAGPREPSPAVSAVPASVPNAGDWIIVRAWSLQYREVTKVTPKLLKLGAGSTRYPTQMNIGDHKIVCAVPDRETAMSLVNSIAGADGEYRRRERSARAEFDARIAKAKSDRDRTVNRLVAQAIEAATADETGTGSAEGESAVAEGHAPHPNQDTPHE